MQCSQPLPGTRWLTFIDTRLHLWSGFGSSTVCPRCSVCLRSCNCPFGILDVERPCPSTTYFEKIGLTQRCREPPTSSAIYGYGNFEPPTLCVKRSPPGGR